jgi:hypothetical protein
MRSLTPAASAATVSNSLLDDAPTPTYDSRPFELRLALA